MYGLVNQALNDYVVKYHSEDDWERIKTEAQLSDAPFMKMQGYDDAITYQIVGAAAKSLSMDVTDLLEAFGRFWVLETAPSAYAELLDSSGSTFSEFMTHLRDLHSRILLFLPNLDAPDFQVKNMTSSSLILCYQSHREGLQHFVIGLIHGLGERFKVEVQVAWSKQGKDAQEPDEFQITWT